MSIIRKITTSNKKIVELLTKNKEYFNEVSKITTEIEKLENKRYAIALKAEKIKGKLRPFVDKEAGELNEFEVITNVKLVNDEVLIEITNELEFYKEELRKKYANKGTEEKIGERQEAGEHNEAGNGERV